MANRYCTYCLNPLEREAPCPVCGRSEGAYAPLPHHLPPGTMLLGRYLIGRVLGEGGWSCGWPSRSIFPPTGSAACPRCRCTCPSLGAKRTRASSGARSAFSTRRAPWPGWKSSPRSSQCAITLKKTARHISSWNMWRGQPSSHGSSRMAEGFLQKSCSLPSNPSLARLMPCIDPASSTVTSVLII